MATATKSTKPAAKVAAPVEEVAVEEVGFGVSDIAELIKVKFDKDVKTRDLRTLLRKMARDGRLDREIVAGNRDRWVWSGPTDPEVDTILDAFEAGELDDDKKEKLDALKTRKAEQRAAKKAEDAAITAAIEEIEEDDESLED